jgi:deoxyribodipyrimidine photo-lyase
MIREERIRFLNQKRVKKGAYVLYWMQASQRAEYNHALQYAIVKANELRQPVIVFFGITDRFPEANERHCTFMLEGLKEVQQSLREKGIQMVVRHKSPEMGAVQLAKKASLAVVDRGYLKVQRQWREYAARRIDCPFIQVESDVIVPVEEASPKEEYTAATLRPKIHKKLNHFLVPLSQRDPVIHSLFLDLDSFDIHDVPTVVSRFHIDHSVRIVGSFHGGTNDAKKRLQDFLEHKLDRFGDLRNDPTVEYVSHLSPYLHFGQISPLYIALKVSERNSPAKEAFLEELIIRRELSMNFVFYNEQYDSFESIPDWAKRTLKAHRKDRRPYLYSLGELEGAKTHDPYWNAAQKEMLLTGKMHGYMRMYWGKKILEWTGTPEEAFRTALYLNNKYELDGRDPNGFAGVAWCFGKHDRPWAPRPIFGNIRYMNDKGLRRKFIPDHYVRMVDQKLELERVPSQIGESPGGKKA